MLQTDWQTQSKLSTHSCCCACLLGLISLNAFTVLELQYIGCIFLIDLEAHELEVEIFMYAYASPCLTAFRYSSVRVTYNYFYQKLKRKKPCVFCTITATDFIHSSTFQHILWDPKALPGQTGNVIPPASPEPTPGPSPRGMCPEHQYRDVCQRRPHQKLKPPQLSPFKAKDQQPSEINLDIWALQPILKGNI